MDEVQRIFTHKSVLELLDQATEDTIEDASKKRRDGHFCLQLPEYSSPLSKLANARSLLKNENLKLEDVDDRLLLKTMKTKTMGRKSLAYGRTYGLGYNLYYHRNPTRRGRSVREKNIPSRLVLELLVRMLCQVFGVNPHKVIKEEEVRGIQQIALVLQLSNGIQPVRLSGIADHEHRLVLRSAAEAPSKII